MTDEAGSYRVTEPRRTPVLSVVLGFGAMAPFAVGAATAWLTAGNLREIAVALTVLWGCAILTFLAGVRRGLSFRTQGGPNAAQIATMFVVFVLGLGASWIFVLGGAGSTPNPVILALAMLIVGYAGLGVLDPLAARRGEVPVFFQRLRPVQMLIPVACLGCLIVLLLGIPRG